VSPGAISGPAAAGSTTAGSATAGVAPYSSEPRMRSSPLPQHGGHAAGAASTYGGHALGATGVVHPSGATAPAPILGAPGSNASVTPSGDGR
jgi:hypothetical protein